MKAHPFEVIEIFMIADRTRFRLLLFVGGPWSAPPAEGGVRKPHHCLGSYPLSSAGLVVAATEALSRVMDIPIQDLAGITSDPHGSIRHDDGPEAA